MFEKPYRGEGDNPTLGLILCAERNAAVAKLFASKYQLLMPSEAELERGRTLLESVPASLSE